MRRREFVALLSVSAASRAGAEARFRNAEPERPLYVQRSDGTSPEPGRTMPCPRFPAHHRRFRSGICRGHLAEEMKVHRPRTGARSYRAWDGLARHRDTAARRRRVSPSFLPSAALSGAARWLRKGRRAGGVFGLSFFRLLCFAVPPLLTLCHVPTLLHDHARNGMHHTGPTAA